MSKGRNTSDKSAKTPATKTLKEKRAAKAEKRTEKARTSHEV